MRIADEAGAAGTSLVLNCASQEYCGAVKPAAHSPQVFTSCFPDARDGALRQIGFSPGARGVR